MKAMNELQVKTFWCWYTSAFNGKYGTRTISKAAERSGVSDNLIKRWHEEFEWEKLAAGYDAGINRTIEKEVTRAIVQNITEAIIRQRRIVNALLSRFEEHIEDYPIEKMRPAEIIALLQYELTHVYEDQQAKPQTNMLNLVLQFMSSEDRTKFYGNIERARDAGILRLDPMGSVGRN